MLCLFWVSKNSLAKSKLETEKPTPNPALPKKHLVYTIVFEKFARTFAFFPVTRKLVQMNFFLLGLGFFSFFRVDIRVYFFLFSGGFSSSEQ